MTDDPRDRQPLALDGETADGVAFEALQRELERGLAEALGGFTPLDRDLEFDPHASADLVGLDGAGRLTLVLLQDGAELAQSSDRVLGRTLDLIAAARSQRSLLERHLGRTFPETPGPLVVLVAESFPSLFASRIAVMGAAQVRLLEVRELRSARGATTWFTPLRMDPLGEAEGIATLLAELDDDVARRIERLDRRLSRLDAELAATRVHDGVEWRWRGEPVCSVAPRDGGLCGRIQAPRHDGEGSEPVESTATRSSVELGAPADESVFLDAALARFLTLASSAASGSEASAAPTSPGLTDVELHPATREATSEPTPGFVEVDTGPPLGLPSGDEPLLSQEELDAFFDDDPPG